MKTLKRFLKRNKTPAIMVISFILSVLSIYYTSTSNWKKTNNGKNYGHRIEKHQEIELTEN